MDPFAEFDEDVKSRFAEEFDRVIMVLGGIESGDGDGV